MPYCTCMSAGVHINILSTATLSTVTLIVMYRTFSCILLRLSYEGKYCSYSSVFVYSFIGGDRLQGILFVLFSLHSVLMIFFVHCFLTYLLHFCLTCIGYTEKCSSWLLKNHFNEPKFVVGYFVSCSNFQNCSLSIDISLKYLFIRCSWFFIFVHFYVNHTIFVPASVA